VLGQWAPHAGVVPYVPHIVLAVVVIALLRDAPETVVTRPAPATAPAFPVHGRARLRRVVVPSAPWVFAAPAIAFALLPAVVGAGHATDGTASVAAVTALTAFSGVLVQPLGRRLEHRAGVAGLVVLATGLTLAAVTAEARLLWLLVPCAIVLGCAYGLCLVAGLVEVQRMASGHDLARLTAVFYAFTYLGFAAPYLLALGAPCGPATRPSSVSRRRSPWRRRPWSRSAPTPLPPERTGTVPARIGDSPPRGVRSTPAPASARTRCSRARPRRARCTRRRGPRPSRP